MDYIFGIMLKGAVIGKPPIFGFYEINAFFGL